ncbi:sensor histidine kinase [Gluconobacter wancherniae]|uniref:sensor histidine kinase n=1 Tax=Gluconobacter wancherniae TaxID=1307955 RepID=UPI001B8CFE37|nr:ATP-binding protein [Gluconobacter wancherniae]MBS1095821.1 sensor histidine kinase [Gluconobacter wancherniae]
MRVVLAMLAKVAGIIAACLLMGPVWQNGFFATAVLIVSMAVFCMVSLITTQLELLRRAQRQELSVVQPADREALLNRALLDHAPVPLLFQKTDGTLHAANRAARRLFETEGRLVAPPSPLLSLIEADRSTSEHAVIRLPSSGGSSRVYAVSVGQGGGVSGIVAYLALMDVEARINAAEAQALRELLQIVSHEIMNSLTPIVSLSATAVELFSDVPTYDTGLMISEALATIRRRADGLERFVRGYRDLARLPAPDLRQVDLGELLRETARLFDARWAGRVALEISLPPERIMVRLDRGQIEQALLNLLNNGAEAALEYPPSQVKLAGAWIDGAVRITVQDNGSGIDATQRERIFEPFVSFKVNGNGIGLSLARQIVRGHGGTLALEDDTASGPWTTLFCIRL